MEGIADRCRLRPACVIGCRLLIEYRLDPGAVHVELPFSSWPSVSRGRRLDAAERCLDPTDRGPGRPDPVFPELCPRADEAPVCAPSSLQRSPRPAGLRQVLVSPGCWAFLPPARCGSLSSRCGDASACWKSKEIGSGRCRSAEATGSGRTPRPGPGPGHRLGPDYRSRPDHRLGSDSGPGHRPDSVTW